MSAETTNQIGLGWALFVIVLTGLRLALLANNEQHRYFRPHLSGLFIVAILLTDADIEAFRLSEAASTVWRRDLMLGIVLWASWSDVIRETIGAHWRRLTEIVTDSNGEGDRNG